jgi:hypothetical protein
MIAFSIVGLPYSIVVKRFRQEVALKFEWNEEELNQGQKIELEEFLERIKELGTENAFFDEEALVYMDGTHVAIPNFVRVLKD